MKPDNLTQIERFKNLIKFIDEHFKDSIDSNTIEEISHYSYRNINRIFQSLQQETIGKHIKRKRLEKAAEYLKYSENQIYDIAIEVGFNDLATFSKAFKKRFQCSPSYFRQFRKEIVQEDQTAKPNNNSVSFTLETLPEFKILYLEHKGNYQDLEAIEKTWEIFYEYCDKNNWITKDSIFFSETLDDNEITEYLQCRTNVALIFPSSMDIIPESLFQIKTHKPQKYAKFIHRGHDESLVNTYQSIYASWITDIQLEFEDKPTLEFYVNHDENVKAENLITEIYIPVK